MMKRRQFLTTSALGAFVSAGTGAPSMAFAAGVSETGELYHQPATDVPVAEKTDVVVCGGGPAGIAAAIAAARKGARVRLIEVHGYLGGVWTAGMVNNIIDYQNKSGLIAEIMAALKTNDAQVSAVVFDVEEMKRLLEELCLRAGVKLLYHTRVVGAVKDGSNRLTHALVENVSGRQAFAAKAFVDATGEGDLAARAGCGFAWGHPVSGRTQPMSLIVLLGGLDAAALRGQGLLRGDISSPQEKAAFRAELQRAGVSPSYGLPTLLRIRDDHFAMMANHEYAASGIDAQQLTDASIRARREVHTLIQALRKRGGIWKDARILATGAQIGVREGRRIHGRYTVTKEDLIRGVRFEDAVCRTAYWADIHALDAGHSDGGVTSEGVTAKPYDIPFRALIAKDVDGLLLAGRCISGDFYAHASYRVTGDAVALGEAAGRAAAVAALTGQLPHQIAWKQISG